MKLALIQNFNKQENMEIANLIANIACYTCYFTKNLQFKFLWWSNIFISQLEINYILQRIMQSCRKSDVFMIKDRSWPTVFFSRVN